MTPEDLAGGGCRQSTVLTKKLHALDAFEAGVEADAFIDRVNRDIAVSISDLKADDFVLEGAGLGGGDGALVALIAVLVDFFLGQTILLGDHFRAHELRELDVRIGGLDSRAHIGAEAVLGRQGRREAHGNAGHALDARGDDDVHGAAHNGLGRELQGLL